MLSPNRHQWELGESCAYICNGVIVEASPDVILQHGNRVKYQRPWERFGVEMGDVQSIGLLYDRPASKQCTSSG